MPYKRTPAAERRKYKVAVICLSGGCFTPEGQPIVGTPEYYQKNFERMVYLHESVDPDERLKFMIELRHNGFKPVDGDKVKIFSKRRPRVSNNEFWQRVLAEAKNLGGQISVVGSEDSQLFRYLVAHPEVSKQVPRHTPTSLGIHGGKITTEQRKMVVSLTTILYPLSMTCYELDRDKYANWIEGLLRAPQIVTHDQHPWLEIPQEFNQIWNIEDSAEGQFVLAITEAGYTVEMINRTIPDGFGGTKSRSFVAVKLR